MIPNYEQPIDTTENIFQNDKIPCLNLDGSFWKEFLLESPNAWERKAGIFFCTFHNLNIYYLHLTFSTKFSM